MANVLQVKRGANADLPTLNAGEFGFSTDTHQPYIGDGVANHELLTVSGWVIDEDNMASDSAIKVPTQQSVKKYVDDTASAGTLSEIITWGTL